MNEFIDFITNNNTIALIAAIVIFIVTIWMLAKRLIGFLVTLVLLGFALLSGFFIANQDLFRDILRGYSKEGSLQDEETYSRIKNQLIKSYEDLKTELGQQKEEFEKILKSQEKEDELKDPNLQEESNSQ